MAARCQSAHLENPHAAIERDRDHVPALNVRAPAHDPNAVDPHMAGSSQRCGCGAGAHDPGVPQPSVDPLPVPRHQRRAFNGALGICLS